MVAELDGLAIGGDLALIALTFALLATMMALRSVVHIFTDPIRGLSIAGIHFGDSIANAIDGAIDDVIDWVRGWLHRELHLLDTLLRGLAWSIVETAVAIQGFSNVITHTFDRIWDHD